MFLYDRNLLGVYPRLFDAVMTTGHSSSPRGHEVTEFPTPIMWTLTQPEEWPLTITHRRINPFFALAEVVWMWSGKGGADFIVYYNKAMAEFLDPGIPYFNAAYGRRIRHAGYAERPFRDTPHLVSTGQLPVDVEVDQLDFVISKLQKDPQTRQAAVSLWDPIKDNFHTSKDYPCNNMVYFSQRDGKLNISVVIRSNDLVWGVPYNMIQFVHLQALIAGSLGLGMGLFTVMCNNLHVYKDLYPDVLKIVRKWAGKRMLGAICEDNLFLESWDMVWPLREFDVFVSQEWEPMDRHLRNALANHEYGNQIVLDASINILLQRLITAFTSYKVPQYWQAVFKVMFMYHCRKAKSMEIFNELLNTLPHQMRWLILDFITKVPNVESD